MNRTRGPGAPRRLLAGAVLTCLVLALQARPGSAGITAELASPTFAEGAGASLGSGMDVEGDFAVLSAPGTKEIHFYTRSLETGQWSAGLTLDLSEYDQLGPAVALGDDLAIYYTVMTHLPSRQWQLRVRFLGLGGGSDEVINNFSGIQLPASLDVDGDLLILGWRPSVLSSRSPAVDDFAGFRALERVQNGFWQQAIFELIQPENTDAIRVGWATATDGERFAVSDPLAGPHGTVRIYERDPGGWVFRHALSYSNIFQPDVHFGSSVAIDGECLAVGMERFNQGLLSPVTDTGAVALLSPNASTWPIRQVVVPDAAPANSLFGRSVSLLGAELLVGSERVPRINAVVSGDVSYFTRSGGDCTFGTWTEVVRLRSLPLVFDVDAVGAFGHAVALSEGGVALVGDPLGETGQGDGRGYSFATLSPIFSDGFESGDTGAWQ